MTISVIAFVAVIVVSLIAGVWIGYDEGRKHTEEDSAKAYNRGHSEGFDDGFSASESVRRSVERLGHGAHW